MKTIKKLSIAVVVLAMCLLLGATALAADSTEVVYITEFDKESLCVSDSAQTITLTVTTSKDVDITAFDALVTVPAGWKIKSITNDFITTDDMYPTKAETDPAKDEEWKITWFHGETANESTNKLAVITIEIPAGAEAGEYSVNFTITAIASAVYEGDVLQDIYPWAEDKTITADFTLKDHSFTTKASTEQVTAATCVAKATYKVQCDNCNVVHETMTVESGEIAADNHAYPETPSSYTVNEDGTHTANYVCGNDASHTKSDDPVEHTYNQEDGTKCVCRAVKPVTNVTVTYKGAALANAYTVSGNEVTVTFDKACKLGYWDATNSKYVAIAATHVEGNTYSFTAPEGVTEVLLVVKGDANASGELDSGDMTRIKAVLMGKTSLTAEGSFAADANASGVHDSGDITRIKAVLMGKTSLTWG